MRVKAGRRCVCGVVGACVSGCRLALGSVWLAEVVWKGAP